MKRLIVLLSLACCATLHPAPLTRDAVGNWYGVRYETFNGVRLRETQAIRFRNLGSAGFVIYTAIRVGDQVVTAWGKFYGNGIYRSRSFYNGQLIASGYGRWRNTSRGVIGKFKGVQAGVNGEFRGTARLYMPNYWTLKSRSRLSFGASTSITLHRQ